jgi:hypothetical protein
MRPEWEIDFPWLIVAHEWAERHCVVPDSFGKGAEWKFRGWQTWCLANFYRVRPDAYIPVDDRGTPPDGVGPSSAFRWRRSQIVLPQKAGKAPYTAAHICIEAVGPAIFGGWAKDGDLYRCADFGCPCGWEYPYDEGEAKGVPWPTPLIQITATSEDQTSNVYDALRPMIRNGPLASVIPKVGEEFIRLPGGDGCQVEPVTSNATSRVGQRCTFIPQDETGLYTKTNGMVKVAQTQRRGAGGMGGRAEETTNGWDPTEGSTAELTAKDAKTLGDIFRFHPRASEGLNYRLKADRRKIHKCVYLKPTEEDEEDGTPWIDLDAIEGEAAELVENDPAQGERFYGNNIVAGGGPAFDIDHWDTLLGLPGSDGKRDDGYRPAKGAVVVIGVDGARYDDALAVVGCEVATGFIWPLDIIERPDNLSKEQLEDYEHDRERVDGVVRDAFDHWQVWRIYCDPQHLDYLMQGWRNDYGQKRVIDYWMYKPLNVAWPVRRFRDAVTSAEISHSGSKVLRRHIGNAKLRELSHPTDDKGRPMHTLDKESHMSPRKIDGAMAAILAWKGRMDAIGANIVNLNPQPTNAVPPQNEPEPRPQTWTPGTAPNLLQPAPDGALSGDIS